MKRTIALSIQTARQKAAKRRATAEARAEYARDYAARVKLGLHVPVRRGPPVTLIEKRLKEIKAGVKHRAKHRPLVWALDDEHAKCLLRRACAYCCKKPAWGIDRIDSSGDYTPHNTAPSCWMCNRMKNDLNIRVFLRHVATITERHKFAEPAATPPAPRYPRRRAG